MNRPITKDELEDMNLSLEQINVILELQSHGKNRRYKYIVLLTTDEAIELTESTGKEFVRATAWYTR